MKEKSIGPIYVEKRRQFVILSLLKITFALHMYENKCVRSVTSFSTSQFKIITVVLQCKFICGSKFNKFPF